MGIVEDRREIFTVFNNDIKVKKGDIRIFTLYHNRINQELCIKAICLNIVKMKDGRIKLYLSGYLGSNVINGWYPLECVKSISIPRYKNAEIRRLFGLQQSYYEKHSHNDLDKLNKKIIKALGNISIDEFCENVKRRIASDTLDYSYLIDVSFSYPHDIKISEQILLDKEDSEDRDKSAIIANRIKPEYDKIREKYRSREKISSLNNKSSRSIGHDTQFAAPRKYYFHSITIKINKDLMYEELNMEDVDEIMKKIHINE